MCDERMAYSITSYLGQCVCAAGAKERDLKVALLGRHRLRRWAPHVVSHRWLCLPRGEKKGCGAALWAADLVRDLQGMGEDLVPQDNPLAGGVRGRVYGTRLDPLDLRLVSPIVARGRCARQQMLRRWRDRLAVGLRLGA